MNRVILGGVLLAAGTATSALAGAAYDDTGSWYVNPMQELRAELGRRTQRQLRQLQHPQAGTEPKARRLFDRLSL
jgi:hypothetical protein